MTRADFLDSLALTIERYESEHPSNNDCGVIVQFFDGTAYSWNGESLLICDDLTEEAISKLTGLTRMKESV